MVNDALHTDVHEPHTAAFWRTATDEFVIDGAVAGNELAMAEARRRQLDG